MYHGSPIFIPNNYKLKIKTEFLPNIRERKIVRMSESKVAEFIIRFFLSFVCYFDIRIPSYDKPTATASLSRNYVQQ